MQEFNERKLMDNESGAKATYDSNANKANERTRLFPFKADKDAQPNQSGTTSTTKGIHI